MSNDELTTAAAFEQLLNRPDQWRRTGRPMPQRFSFRYKLSLGIKVSLDTKEKILQEAGYQLKQEKVWALPAGTALKKPFSIKVKK